MDIDSVASTDVFGQVIQYFFATSSDESIFMIMDSLSCLSVIENFKTKTVSL
jgi:hypothetical protein